MRAGGHVLACAPVGHGVLSLHCPGECVYLAKFSVSLETSCMSNFLMEVLAHIFKALYQPHAFIEEWLDYYLE